MKCKHCGSEKVIKAGIEYAGKKKQRWLCKDCGRFTLMMFKSDAGRMKNQEV